jgi:hypothetical protein
MPQHVWATHPKTHHLFQQIVAAVTRSSEPMTVVDLGAALNTPREVIAHCIALHLYLDRTQLAELPLPPPIDYWVPSVGDVITRDMLEPKGSGRMPAVEAVIEIALGTVPGTGTVH